jgi:hypothetical protein
MGRTDNPHLSYMRFPFPKGSKDGKGRALASIIVRETCFRDEENAGRVVDGENGKISFTRALFYESVVALRYVGNDADVEIDAPDPERLDGWPTRSSEFAMRCFHKINSVPEMEEHLGKMEAVDPKTLKTTAG